MKVRQPHDMLETNLVVSHLAGSKAYGTSTPTSDTDIRGIFCADEVWHRSPWYSVNECSIPEEEDTKYYELTKFMQLLVDQNPNIVETLWVDRSSIIETSEAYEFLREHRKDLLSSKTAFTFSGYAVSQLKRIKGHNKWINNPQSEEPPRQIDYVALVHNFTEDKILKLNGESVERMCEDHRLVPYGNDIFGLYEMKGYQLFDTERFLLNTNADDLDRESLSYPKMVVKFNKEEYRRDKDTWHNYWTWKRNRNEARAELEEKYGYDCKHAMHLVRLLRMGEEILKYGEVNVYRQDAEELLQIRNGAWEYEKLVEYAEALDSQIRGDLYRTTDLRKRVDTIRATEILFEAQRLVWSKTSTD